MLVTSALASVPGLKINLDEADAGHRARFHVVNAAAQCEKALEGVGNVGFDLFGRHAVVESSDEHDGNVDRRKHIHGHLRQAGNAEDANEKTNHDDEVRMAYGKCRHLRAYSIPGASTSFGETSWPSLN